MHWIESLSPDVRRRLQVGVGALCFIVTGCSGEPNSTDGHVLNDWFEGGAPVTISDEVLKSLTARVTQDEADRLGARIGYVPLTALREHDGDPVQPSAEGLATTTVSGEHLANAISPVPRIILETPYWTGIFRRLGARGRNGAFVATNLLYKIYRYGGEGRPPDSISGAPPSWRQARQPSMGEFPPSRHEAWSSYLDSISVIRALAVVADSVLVVSVGHYAEEGDSNSLDPTEVLEVYIGRRMAGADLEAPGELVAYSDSSLFFLNRSAQPNGSTLTEHTWRGRER